MKLTMLGTGNARATKCYNTCFVLEDHRQYLLVDGGGGNGIFHQLESAGYDWKDMRQIFVTHQHLDHLMGIVWMIWGITKGIREGTYDGDAYIYSHADLIALLDELSQTLLKPKEYALIGKRLHLVTLGDGEVFEAIGNQVQVFDIGSTKMRQFGFSMTYENNRKLTCCGDEPVSEAGKAYAEGSDWLLHEAFCLYDQRDVFRPYEKHHSTVKDAATLAETLHVKNLLLYHTEDKNLSRRKELYSAEGRQYFHGNLYVPDDLESFDV